MTAHAVVTPGAGECALSDAAKLHADGMCVSAETYHWRIPSKPQLIEKVVMQLKERAEACGICGEDRITGLVISLTEAITNALVHGNLEISSDIRERTDGAYGKLLAQRCGDGAYSRREVLIDVHWNGEVCEWIISDAGNGFDVERLLQRLENEEPSAELASGRGILLMKAFMDEVQWRRGGREVRLVMGRPGKSAPTPENRTRLRKAVRAKGFDAGPEEGVDLVATSVSPQGFEILGVRLEHAKRLLIEVDINGGCTLVPAEVRHVTKLGAEWMQIDCRFERPANEKSETSAAERREAIERVLRSTVRAADQGHERRENDRFEYTGVLRVQRKDGTVYHGVARDLSRGGLAFIGNFELIKGEVLTLTLEPETATPVKVTCEVTRCQQLAGVYRDFGVRFFGG